VDKDRHSLKELESNHRARFHTTRNLILLKDDFSLDQSLPQLDGIVMANSLHFFKDKEKILRHVRGYLKPNGALLLVEYNVDVGNMWVPYPISFNVCRVLVKRAGFTQPKLLAKTPSRFLDEFYSAVAYQEQK
jgi:SAM-dependent methyltransferase